MRKSLLAAAILATWLPAYAVTQTVVITGDVTLGGPTLSFTYELAGTGFTPPFSVPLAVGDVFDFTMNFMPGQTLTLNNPQMFWAFSFADVSSDVQGTGQLTLLDAAGLPLLTSDMKTDTEGSVHFGQFFYASDFTGGLPSSVTIGGLHYVGTVDAYVEPGVTTRQYADPRLTLTADSVVVNAVPEPAPSLMLLAGLAAVALLKRRRPH